MLLNRISLLKNSLCCILFFYSSVCCSFLFGQNPSGEKPETVFVLKGKITDFCTGKGIRKSKWKVTNESNQIAHLKTNFKGEFEIMGLPYGETYQVHFSAPGYTQVTIRVNTQLAPTNHPSNQLFFYPQLFPNIIGIDTNLFVKYPREIINFNTETQLMDFDREYQKDIVAKYVEYQDRFKKAIELQSKKCKVLKKRDALSEKEYLAMPEEGFQFFGGFKDDCSGEVITNAEVELSNEKGEKMKLSLDKDHQFDSGKIPFGDTWKVEFNAQGYYSRYIIINTSDMNGDMGPFGFEMEITLLPELEGFDDLFFKKNPIAVAQYDYKTENLLFNLDYNQKMKSAVNSVMDDYLAKAGQLGITCPVKKY